MGSAVGEWGHGEWGQAHPILGGVEVCLSARAFVLTAYWHNRQRCHNREACFFGEEDYSSYLHWLGEARGPPPARCRARRRLGTFGIAEFQFAVGKSEAFYVSGKRKHLPVYAFVALPLQSSPVTSLCK
jgi:hypothetical protein